ncbi:universal stress protein [Cellulomonas sp.]|uniref:universal stress protein n=1 Tax=Cellulomonas sp. TaxID=40001 RepID=UPI001B2EAF93|nr:universal stress protein [Cellulomonas sp.]MBO9555003.1 universal stress protein [Cellulomonas sp.]
MHTDGPVVVAVDGSEHSRQTIEWGVDVARAHGAALVLAHAYRDPREATRWGWYPVVLDAELLEVEAVTAVRELRDKVRANHPDVVVEARVLHGPAVPTLRDLTDEARVLVVGARGEHGRSGIGPVGDHLVTHARCPVLVARTPTPGDGALPVAVGVDGSAASVDAAHLAAREARHRGAVLRIVHARSPQGPFRAGGRPATDLRDREDPAQAAAWRLAEEVVASHPGVKVELVLCEDDPVPTLLAESRTAQVVVVGSRGLGVFRGMLLGSVSREVAADASCSVLVLRDGTERGAA